jgi:hypothetical protein
MKRQDERILLYAPVARQKIINKPLPPQGRLISMEITTATELSNSR